MEQEHGQAYRQDGIHELDRQIHIKKRDPDRELLRGEHHAAPEKPLG